VSDKRVIVVTGASRGIGRAIATALAEPGCEIIVNYSSNSAAAQETAAAVTAKAGVLFSIVSTFLMWKRLKNLSSRSPRITAPGCPCQQRRRRQRQPLGSHEAFPMGRGIEHQPQGVFLCSQAVVKMMMRQRYGRIINVTSIVGVIGNAGQCNYSASKAGIIGFTHSIAASSCRETLP